MSESKPPAITASSVKSRRGSSYPPPFDTPCAGREKHALGDVFGLTDYGVNQVTLPPGTASSQRHWHSAEDEFVYILAGRPTLVTDRGRTALGPGMCAGFPAGSGDGHHLLNETDDVVSYLEVGSRRSEDDVEYSDIDMRIIGRNSVRGRGRADGYRHKDGTPYA